MINIYDSEGMTELLAGSIDQALKDILRNRLNLLEEYLATYDFGDLMTVHIVELGDSLEVVEQGLAMPVLENLVDGLRYPDPEFEPSWEFCIVREGYFEITYALSDSGQGLVLVVPDQDGVVPELRAMLKAYATTNLKPSD